MGVTKITVIEVQTKLDYLTMCFIPTVLILSYVSATSYSFHLPASRHRQGDTCLTSTQEEGSCVQINNCETLEQIFGQNMSKEKVSFLRNSACGFDNQIPKICCPSRPVVVTKTNIEETTTNKAPSTTIGASDEFDFKLRDGELKIVLRLHTYSLCFRF